jgi:soluble cytochrome b562
MGMRIQSSDAASSTQATGAAALQKKQQNLKDLFSAIQSGNLGTAQNALKSLTGGSGTVNPNSPLAAIAQAVQSGNVSAAQKAAQDLQSRRSSQHAQTAPSAPTNGNLIASGQPGALLSVLV